MPSPHNGPTSVVDSPLSAGAVSSVGDVVLALASLAVVGSPDVGEVELEPPLLSSALAESPVAMIGSWGA
jgi:hypothetical protein